MNRRDFMKNTGLTTGGLLLLQSSRPALGSLISKSENMKITNPAQKNICVTCGTRYQSSKFNEGQCPVCMDDRQYVNLAGQQWTSYAEMEKNQSIKFHKLREDIYELKVVPSFAIGQKAHLILGENGNVLWDCLPFVDEASLAFIEELGGLDAIAISHPHYYGLMAEWAEYFDCPIFLHQLDSKWVMDENSKVKYFSEERLQVMPGIQVIHTGGHFPGSTVLHYKRKDKTPALFGGDSLYLSLSKKHLSAMYSYPNNIPLSGKELFDCFNKIDELKFDAFFGAFSWQNLFEGAEKVFRNSLQRYKTVYINKMM